MIPKIILVILGIVLLSSVATILPVFASDTDSYCNWRSSMYRQGFESLSSQPPQFMETGVTIDDYTHVMADIFSKFHESDGKTGDVTFYYKGPNDSIGTKIATKTLTPEGFVPGETRGFNFGIKLCPAGDVPVRITLICEYPGGQESMSKEILVKESLCDPGETSDKKDPKLESKSELDSDGDGVPDSEDPCPELFGNIGGCPDTPIILPPSAPTSLTASASDGSVLLKWQTPDDEGGWEGLVKDYIIEYKSESDSTWQVFDDGYSDSTSALITNLQNDIQYQFRVYGENDGRLGLGDASTIVTATPTTVTAPTIEPSSADEGGGCLIATATYGSELAPQVQQLREIRDNSLLQTESGTLFMSSFNNFYYSFSPIIADYERENPLFKEMVKIAITPMISSLSILNYVDMDSEESVLGYGISLILLNIGMYVGIPAIVIVGIRKRF